MTCLHRFREGTPGSAGVLLVADPPNGECRLCGQTGCIQDSAAVRAA
ncbi:putative NBD/HSP70 family sugar kinase [Streptomyces olivoverticillatus]|uniref:Putative NBD/HSP70 family sugar kinase n=1 Tax=Streptomyces olivoverticillatus TaxID=66427 RepID=A0A7W7PIL3_9ACTN|nr:hypothetical protein [Streptomyces olivoverticillatus]MBB4891227.1 putative NBD/HSP70 family sugar kinase [Streptomyces olivoverticillatus]